MRSDGDAGKSPRQLEHEVDQQRQQLTETMQALEDKFSSRAIYDQTAGYMAEHGREFAENLGNSIKANPLPVALTAVGLMWMMMGQRQPVSYQSHTGEGRMERFKEKAGETAGELKGKAGELKGRASSARERASASGHEIRNRAAATGQNLRESADHFREGLSRSASSARSSFDYYMHEQPLAVGALGIALGALMGASLPRTEAEHRTMGEFSERVRNKASEVAEKGYQKASQVGESVGREAQEAFDSERRPEQQPASRTPQGPGPAATP